MAWQAVEGVVFRTAGSSAAREGEAIKRPWRDMSQAWSHYFNVIGTWNDREVAREFLHDSASASAFFDGTQ